MEYNNDEQGYTLQNLLSLLWKRRLTITAITLAVLSAAFVVHFSMTAKYKATSILMIKDPKMQKVQFNSSTDGPQDTRTVRNDIALLTSPPVVEKVVRDLYFSERRKSMELFGTRHYASPLASLLSPAVDAVAGKVAQGSVSESERRQPREMEEKNIRGIAQMLYGRVTVENERETNVLKVSVTSPFPEEAALLTNAICQAYQQMDISWNSEQAQSINRFVREQLGEQQKKVDDIEGSLSGYMRQQGIYEVTGNAQQLLQKMTEVDSRYNDIMAEYNILSKRLEFVKERLTAEEKAFSAGVAKNVNPQLQSFQDRIRAEEGNYFKLVQEQGPNAPDSKELRQKIDVMKSQLDMARRSRIAGELAAAGRTSKYQFDLISEQLQTDVKLAELNFAAQEFRRLKNYYDGMLSRLPKKQIDYARMQRDRDVLSNTYTFLKGKYEESRMQIASEIGRVIIVGAAVPPREPEMPDMKKTILVGLMFGLGLGVAAVVMQDKLDERVKEDNYHEKYGLTRLALVPLVNSDGRGGSTVPLFSDNPLSEFAESFRDLRTNISFARKGQPLRSILVTGTAVGEGISTVCANLGVASSMIGKKVLIIDSDLRRPSQHTIFHIPAQNRSTRYRSLSI